MKSLANLPKPSDRRIAVSVKPAAERALRQGHPWLFDRSIRRISHEGTAGDLAVIFDAKDRFLAIGLYDPDSPIRIRILHHGQPEVIDAGWFRACLSRAFAMRESLPATSTTGYRLVHGENDGLPGFVLDRYGDSGVVRLDTAAWLPHLALLLNEVLALMPMNRLLLRLSRRVQELPQALHGLQDGQLLVGTMPDRPLVFRENGLLFEVDPVKGQKTGFFLDQRDNRARLEGFIRADGRLQRVLNTFAYTGGFSTYAARAGAEQLTDVDASEPALSGAARNLALNLQQWAASNLSHRSICGDAFAILEELSKAGRLFDVVVIDPPSFASNSQQIPRAMNAYRRLAQLGLALLRTQGLLVMASCSSRIEADVFFDLVRQAANESDQPLVELERTGHPLDHPIGFPEGAYLKCLFARKR